MLDLGVKLVRRNDPTESVLPLVNALPADLKDEADLCAGGSTPEHLDQLVEGFAPVRLDQVIR